jgi:ABC-type branched-subunit amino acid transport system ATPase component
MINEINIVCIENLFAGYNGKSVLNGLNLFLQKGEICCVIGEEGSGKSTLMRVITQQLQSIGKITYNGNDLSKIPTAKMTKHKVDFIAQGGNILNGFTVEEHVCLALSERHETEKSIVWEEIEQTFPKLITQKKQVAGRLSGGERMILSFACVMATDANFLVLDEPTAGLAPETCTVIGDFILKMKNERSKTILLLEHNYDFAFQLADTVVILRDGKFSIKFPPKDFKKTSFIDEILFGALNLKLKI